MTTKLCRTILSTVAALALAAVPALADPAPAAPPAPAGCAPELELFSPGAGAPVCAAPTLEASLPEPEFMGPGFRGYCRCSCSLTKNCNTSADCGGSPCLAGVTCC